MIADKKLIINGNTANVRQIINATDEIKIENQIIGKKIFIYSCSNSLIIIINLL